MILPNKPRNWENPTEDWQKTGAQWLQVRWPSIPAAVYDGFIRCHLPTRWPCECICSVHNLIDRVWFRSNLWTDLSRLTMFEWCNVTCKHEWLHCGAKTTWALITDAMNPGTWCLFCTTLQWTNGWRCSRCGGRWVPGIRNVGWWNHTTAECKRRRNWAIQEWITRWVTKWVAKEW